VINEKRGANKAATRKTDEMPAINFFIKIILVVNER
jgi:hypothetical protein